VNSKIQIYNNIKKKSEFLFKILLLGDSGVGKSCIILRYIENTFSQNLMNSIGVDFKLKNIEIEGKRIKLQVWDTAGQERFRTITTSYYKGAQAIVVVYDITDKESFEHVKNWMADVDKFAKEGVLRILVGNKCDLEHQRVVTKENGKDLADKYGIQFMETSAKETINVDLLFENAAKSFLSRQVGGGKEKKNVGSGVNLNESEVKKEEKKGCC